MRMSRKPSAARPRVVCQEVRFVEVEFPLPVQPRLVIQFSDGLSLLVEDERSVGLAGEFIAAFRAQERRSGKGGSR